MNETGLAEGLSVDMALADARAMLPALKLREAELDKDGQGLKNLTRWCGRYSPWTNIDDVDGLWLDISGCGHLFGGESALIDDFSKRLKSFGVTHRLGVAETPGAAWAIARYCLSSNAAERIVSHGQVRDALSDMPVAGLRLAGDTHHLLKRLGLKTIGQLYSIPRSALARRFKSLALSEQVLLRLDQALGTVAEPISPLEPPSVYRTRTVLANPMLVTDGLQPILQKLLGGLCMTLEKDGQGVRRLTLAAFRVDGTVGHISVNTSRPVRDPAHLRRLFRDHIELLDPGFGIETVILSADRIEPLGADQLDLTNGAQASSAENERAVGRLVDRLASKLGPQSVARIAHKESHLPERAEVHIPATHLSACDCAPPSAHKTFPQRPITLFDRPEPIQVMAEIPDGPPMHFVWRRVPRRIARAQGPERLAPEWWNDFKGEERLRDYYKVEDDRGSRYWVFREGLYSDTRLQGEPVWYIHGLFA